MRAWESWLEGMPLLNNIAVQRCFFPAVFGKLDNVQLHHFCNVSCSGCAVVSYIVATKAVVMFTVVLFMERHVWRR